MKYTLYILAAFILAGFVYTAASFRTPASENASLPPSLPESGAMWKTIRDDEPLVSVEVTPLALGGSEWRFAVALNTHSVELDQDLTQLAELLDDRKRAYKPIAWEGAGPGGHHREGVLIFRAIQPAPTSIELKIKDVGGIAERSFTWNLQ